MPTPSSRLCSTHFKDSDYMERPGALIRRLKTEAVPSIFNFPKHLLKNTNERRVLVRNTSASTSISQSCSSKSPQEIETIVVEESCTKMVINLFIYHSNNK